MNGRLTNYLILSKHFDDLSDRTLRMILRDILDFHEEICINKDVYKKFNLMEKEPVLNRGEVFKYYIIYEEALKHPLPEKKMESRPNKVGKGTVLE